MVEIDPKAAAQILGVRASTLSQRLAVGEVPFPARKVRGRWLLEADGLAGALDGACACPLVQMALDAARRGTDVPGLTELAVENRAAMRRAVSQAYSGVVLCRSAHDAERSRLWDKARQLLRDALRDADRAQLPTPKPADFLTLGASLEAQIAPTVHRASISPDARENLNQRALATIEAYETVKSYNALLVLQRSSPDDVSFASLRGTVEFGEPDEDRRGVETDLDGEQVARILESFALPIAGLTVEERAAAFAVAQWVRSVPQRDWRKRTV